MGDIMGGLIYLGQGGRGNLVPLKRQQMPYKLGTEYFHPFRMMK
jgi:hypothetical protein